MENLFNDRIISEENVLKDISITACLISLALCILGLVAVLNFALNRKGKELSIRKVLGASMRENLLYINRSYLIIFCLAAVVAVPLAYRLAGVWLENFIYKINVSTYELVTPLIVFLVLAGAVSVLICLGVLRRSPTRYLSEI